MIVEMYYKKGETLSYEYVGNYCCARPNEDVFI